MAKQLAFILFLAVSILLVISIILGVRYLIKVWVVK